jgi:hypothetical protein
MGPVYYSSQNLSNTKRFKDLRDLIFITISKQHPGWNMEAFAMADTDEERYKDYPPPPTVPH